MKPAKCREVLPPAIIRLAGRVSRLSLGRGVQGIGSGPRTGCRSLGGRTICFGRLTHDGGGSREHLRCERQLQTVLSGERMAAPDRRRRLKVLDRISGEILAAEGLHVQHVYEALR